MVKLAQAVEAVHAAGLLHRDLKGDNMLVRGEDGALVLVDFGAGAAPWVPSITRGGLAPGHLHYRSPEAVAFFLGRGPRAGARYRYTVADELYALGVGLYRLLTDVYPLEGEEALVLADIVAVEPEAPREVNGRVPEALSALCLRLLEKEPGARPASVRALREALEAALREADAGWDVPLCYGWDAQGLSTERPEEARGAAPKERLRRWVREKPRRGRKPAVPVASTASVTEKVLETPDTAAAGAEVPPVQPQALEAGPEPGGPVVPPRRAWGPGAFLKGAGGLAVLVLVGVGGAHLGWHGQRHAGPVHEVARPEKPPEAARGAVPPGAPPPASVAPATPPEETRVKTPPSAQPPKKKLPPGPGTTARSLTLAACTALAGCTGAQAVRPPSPPPEDCPPGALEAMEQQLDMRLYSVTDVTLPLTAAQESGVYTVTPGQATVRVLDAMGKLKAGSLLSGRFFVGEERLYGRFTEARMKNDPTVYPVCFELTEVGSWSRKGMPLKPGSTPEAPRVFSTMGVHKVKRFE